MLSATGEPIASRCKTPGGIFWMLRGTKRLQRRAARLEKSRDNSNGCPHRKVKLGARTTDVRTYGGTDLLHAEQRVELQRPHDVRRAEGAVVADRRAEDAFQRCDRRLQPRHRRQYSLHVAGVVEQCLSSLYITVGDGGNIVVTPVPASMFADWCCHG